MWQKYTLIALLVVILFNILSMHLKIFSHFISLEESFQGIAWGGYLYPSKWQN